MKVEQRAPILIFGSQQGLCKMSDLQRVHRFIEKQLSRKVMIEGVKDASQTSRGTMITAPVVSSTNKTSGINVIPQRKAFKFSKHHGLVKNSEFTRWVDWVQEALAQTIQSNDFSAVTNSPGKSQVDFKMDPSLI